MLLTVFTLLAFFDLNSEGRSPWWNYPGLELWKFINLAVFIGVAFYLHKRFGRPIHEGLRSRSEAIKRELLRAREERDRAVAKLAEVDARFATLDEEVARAKARTRAEADAEIERIRFGTEREIAKMREQAKREIESASKAVMLDLRRFAALESVRLAEEILEREIGPEDDARLTRLNVEELGRTHP